MVYIQLYMTSTAQYVAQQGSAMYISESPVKVRPIFGRTSGLKVRFCKLVTGPSDRTLPPDFGLEVRPDLTFGRTLVRSVRIIL